MERAANALRSGKPVILKDGREIVMVFAVETMTAAQLAAARKRMTPALILTHARANTLKIRLYTPGVVALALEKNATVAELRAIADPTADLSAPMKGPFDAMRGKLPASFAAAIKLAKLAGLLPAVVAAKIPKADASVLSIAAKDVRDYEDEAVKTLAIVTRARVPLEGAEKTELIAFRSADGGPEHYAILIDAPSPSKPVLTRLHSECFTGDLLGSLKCDCGSQLRGAIEAIAKAGGGVLLYLAQEGRGIGLINKLRAYRLQDQGFDTLEANRRLGFENDERLYGIAAKMLSLLNYTSVRLMTNNPDKVDALNGWGVTVAERVPHAFPSNAHNENYLAAKARAGHLL
ncbi:MAG TPA: GTP cyclohydrolase II RibA [Rhizomicrobium sp.]|nr:GTP cyclohydrolase II RibA [Rhizomicrobium sp.]